MFGSGAFDGTLFDGSIGNPLAPPQIAYPNPFVAHVTVKGSDPFVSTVIVNGSDPFVNFASFASGSVNPFTSTVEYKSQ